jgi:hypothetical protein
MLARVTPLQPGFVRETYECPRCEYLWDIDAPDPIKAANGWVSGELGQPK